MKKKRMPLCFLITFTALTVATATINIFALQEALNMQGLGWGLTGIFFLSSVIFGWGYWLFSSLEESCQ